MAVKTPTKTNQLTEIIRKKLYSGKYTPGTRFYTEREIAARFGVSRAIAAKAIYRLVSEGLLESRHGSGTYVLDKCQKKSQPIVNMF